jgi:exo-beta-1,3-glucanase (GH17 family)
MPRSLIRRVVLLLGLAALVVAAWYVPNRPQDPPGGHAGDRFASLSFDAYRPWESPLTDHFPTRAEADSDMALVAHEAGAVRTYAAIDGPYDAAALAQKYGVKVWQGIWLGGDRAKNELEMARGIALARQYPETVVRVVVGNEVLLRRDLPPAELIADIDRVKKAVRQPVAYGDVWDFWKQFPEVAPHVDVMLVHLLPYWEDVPTGIDGAVAKVDAEYHEMKRLFPGKQIAIGETGWPSRGRERADAVPGRVNEARFLRALLALSRTEKFDYNFIEAFDQVWKYENEGIVGANWGLFDAQRLVKIPVSGPISEDPDWAWHAAVSVAAGLLLALLGLRHDGGDALKLAPDGRAGPGVGGGALARDVVICGAGMSLGAAFGLCVSVALATLYDIHLEIAATVNIAGQALLAVLAMLRMSGRIAGAPGRTARDTSEAVRALFTRFRLPPLVGMFEDVCFLFVWTAAVMQMLLLFDPRYREFPISTFAVPLVVAAWRIALGDVTRVRDVSLLDLFTGSVLAIGAVASIIQEGMLNTQSLLWNGCAILLAAVPVLRNSKLFGLRSSRANSRQG